MKAHHSPGQFEEVPGGLARHDVSFQGPDARRIRDLRENQRGHVNHVFVSQSIFPQTFETTASTQLTALKVVGPAIPQPVTIPGVPKGAFRPGSREDKASQELEHHPGTGISLPHMATAEFATTVTDSRTGTKKPLANRIDVTLMP
jgi:hypothetical protein